MARQRIIRDIGHIANSFRAFARLQGREFSSAQALEAKLWNPAVSRSTGLTFNGLKLVAGLPIRTCGGWNKLMEGKSVIQKREGGTNVPRKKKPTSYTLKPCLGPCERSHKSTGPSDRFCPSCRDWKSRQG